MWKAWHMEHVSQTMTVMLLITVMILETLTVPQPPHLWNGRRFLLFSPDYLGSGNSRSSSEPWIIPLSARLFEALDVSVMGSMNHGRKNQSSFLWMVKDGSPILVPDTSHHLLSVHTLYIHCRRVGKGILFYFLTFSSDINLIPHALQGQDENQGRTTVRKLTALHVKLPNEW